MLQPGDRCPDLVFGTGAQAWRLAEAACGRAVLLLDGRASALSDSATAETLATAAAEGIFVAWIAPPDPAVAAPGQAMPAPDHQGLASRLFPNGEADRPLAIALDANHRMVAASADATALGELIWALASLRAEAPTGLIQATAPVLFVPDVFEPALCTALIRHFEAGAPGDSAMPRTDGTAGAVDPTAKVRQDLTLGDDTLGQAVTARLARRLLPEIAQALCYRATRFERPKLVRYDAATGGHFRVHRDNPSPATAHRRFALSLNLNADFEGGHLVFPEYDARTYAPPAGGALVFACALAHGVAPIRAGRRYALITFLHHAPEDLTAKAGQRDISSQPLGEPKQ